MFDFSKIGIKPGFASGYKPEVTDTQISKLEKHFGHALPANYLFYLKNYHGGISEAINFGAYNEDIGLPLGYELRNFFIVDELTDRPLNIWWNIEEYSEFMGSDTLPFADDGDNRIFYLKWENNIAQVWVLVFLSEEGPDTYFLLNSFDELLGSLFYSD